MTNTNILTHGSRCKIDRYPALDAWGRELRAGDRTRATFDPLWAAACSEASAREFLSIPELHDALMRDAARIIREAARRAME